MTNEVNEIYPGQDTEKLINSSETPLALFLRERLLQKAFLTLLDTDEIQYDATSIMNMVVMPEDIEFLNKHLVAIRSLDGSGQFNGDFRESIVRIVNEFLMNLASREEEKMAA